MAVCRKRNPDRQRAVRQSPPSGSSDPGLPAQELVELQHNLLNALAAASGYAQLLDRELVASNGPVMVRVLGNLLINAAKYSPPGTTIKISLRAVVGWTYMTVEDHGAGIEPSALRAMFETAAGHLSLHDFESAPLFEPLFVIRSESHHVLVVEVQDGGERVAFVPL